MGQPASMVKGTVKPALFGAVHAVARIPEAGHNIALFVEVAVDRRGEHLHIGMRRVEGLHAFRRGQQAQEPDVVGAAPLSFSTAAIEEFAVASIGSTTITRRSEMFSGALK